MPYLKATLLNTISTSERLSLFLSGSYSYVDTAVSGRGHFQDFRPGFRFWHVYHVDRHGHFTLKQLRLPVLNEAHTNSYTGPRLKLKIQFLIFNFLTTVFLVEIVPYFTWERKPKKIWSISTKLWQDLVIAHGESYRMWSLMWLHDDSETGATC
jgi:hypothetical protein